MTTELAVWLQADEVGALRFDEGCLSFQYLPDWLARTGAAALSCSLPFQVAPFDDHHSRPFFAGLLPEGNLRHLISQQLQIPHDHDFALLQAIGRECAGAISLLPPGTGDITADDSGEIQWLDDLQMLQVLDELPRRPMLAGMNGARLTLSGAHDKLPVAYDGVRIGLPTAGRASSHILKLPIPGLQDSIPNEAFCLALAHALGLPAVLPQLHTVGERQCLLVPRYDRQVDAKGGVRRLHQEDFCQALGVPPEMKYESAGGPGLAACFQLLRHVTRPSAPQVLRLLDYVIFNVLVGNHGAHARNFSLLHQGNSPVLAPLYDVMATEVYFTLPPKMVMKLGGQSTFSAIQARHWDRFADSAGLSRSQTRKRVLQLARALPEAAAKLQSSPEFAGHPLIADIAIQATQRCEFTAGRLAGARAS